jgi:hypothetical protein
MRAGAAALLVLALLHGVAALAQESIPAITLALPHPLKAGETAWIEVVVGPLGRGQEIAVATTSNRELGVISPFGVRTGSNAGTYSLPVPADAIRNGRISIRLTITQFGTTRAPTPGEVRGVSLKRAPR